MAAGFGAYGKIPGLGDFLRLGMPPGFVRAWDGWLQAAMTEARARLGDRWTGCYMSAPIWRFTLPAGMAGEAAATGVMMPSVDRVGRQFPLALAAAADCPPELLPALHLGAGPVFAALEAAALDALEDGMDAAMLAERLAAIAPPAVPQGIGFAAPSGWLDVSAADAAGLAAGLACALTLRHGALPGYWSCIAGGGGHRLMVLPEMPRAETAAALFDPALREGSRAAPEGRDG
ncbi:type VI secretion system-associated protein TagF [Mangrovicoccus sp. HB161399]|uniref:type VI secretion system-associated protein TagF n=1 Tax=Mangrovicoccus sp. HB161399 TaxID=2720392 RepID=UPI001551893D|nr:type VI secretion system-associated protein TagF [Mangrovicoccus sp. HB161399]